MRLNRFAQVPFNKLKNWSTSYTLGFIDILSCFNHANCVHLNSIDIIKYLLASPCQQIYVCLNGIEPSRYEGSIKSGLHYSWVLHIGLVENKYDKY